MGPLLPNGIIGPEWNFVFAILLGILFGFALEGSGFSSSRNIVGVFYGYNFVVLRVFFTALIVAMVGLVYFDYMGWLKLSSIFILPTYSTSMIVGGLIMGVGFVMGGFCPGTSFTAIAIGKIDAVVYTLGIYVGIFIFSEIFPLVESIYYGGEMGSLTLPEFFGTSAKWIAFAFVVIALAAFWILAPVEKKVRKNYSEFEF